jgi:hypothetical protein
VGRGTTVTTKEEVKMIFNTAARLVKRLYYLLWLGPRGYGKPLPKDTLESQYHEGYFASMDTIDELSRYMVIVGYIHGLHQSPTILDVGCGPDRLVDLLSAFSLLPSPPPPIRNPAATAS